MIDLLIQVHAGLMPGAQVDRELQPIDGHVDRLHRFSGQKAREGRESLVLARRDLIAFVHRTGPEHLLDGLHDVGLVLFHAQRTDLEDDDIVVLVDDQPRQEIGLGTDHAIGRGLGHVTLADLEGGANPVDKEGRVHLHALVGEHAHLDLGTRVVETHPEKPVAVVFQLHQFAIGGRLGTALERAGVDPGVSSNQSIGFTGLHHQGGQRGFHFCRQPARAGRRD